MNPHSYRLKIGFAVIEFRLLRKLRLDVSSSYHFVEPPLTEEADKNKILDETALYSRALEHRMDLKAIEDISKANHWDIQIASSTYLPKLDLIGGITGGAHYLNNQSVNGLDVVQPINPL